MNTKQIRQAGAMLLSVLFGLTTGVQAQQRLQGVVYEDRNGDRQQQRNEPGIPGVVVANGTESTVTNQAGLYRLPMGDDAIVFVVKPSAYELPLDSQHLPRHYYIHKPQGSPPLEYAGVAPTGPLPHQVDFPLLPAQADTAFRVLLFGDPQPHFKEHVEYFDRRIVQELQNTPDASFGLVLGDVGDEDLALYPDYKSSIQKIGIPFWHIIGNHDLNFDTDRDSLADETFERHFGPTTFAFNHGNIHFLLLDNVLYPDPRGKSTYWGGFRDDQKRLIQQLLSHVKDNRMVVVAMHISPYDEDAFNPEDLVFLFGELKRFERVVFLTAHSHIQRNIVYGASEGWHGKHPLHEFNAGTTSGDFYAGFLDEHGIPKSTMRDGTPPGYAYLNINGTDYTIDYKVAGSDASVQMHLEHPLQVVKDRHTPAHLTVNFYNGSQGDSVMMRINEGAWQAMQQVFEIDPRHALEVLQWNQSVEPKYARWPDIPYPSSHLWKIRIPSKLPLGTQRIEVRARDRYGRYHYGSSRFDIVAPLREYP